MRVAIAFDTPYVGWSHDDHWRQLEAEIAIEDKAEPETEYQIADALRVKGHDVRMIGLRDDVSVLLDDLRANPVDLVFNATESFQGNDRLDYLVPALLESEGYPYTGAPPLGLMITRNKGMSKKILAHHGIKVPRFATYRVGEPVPDDPGLAYPVIVKPLQMDASVGIAKASVVRDRAQLVERVEFVHQRFGEAAIAEEFIEGRELYVGILGNGGDARLLPTIELVFDKDKTPPEARIATPSVKWNDPYREKMGIRSQFARPLSKEAQAAIEAACRVAYESLWLRDYARIDLRLDANDDVWVLEANANPFLGFGHEMANAAKKAGFDYYDFMQRIVRDAAQRYG